MVILMIAEIGKAINKKEKLKMQTQNKRNFQQKNRKKMIVKRKSIKNIFQINLK